VVESSPYLTESSGWAIEVFVFWLLEPALTESAATSSGELAVRPLQLFAVRSWSCPSRDAPPREASRGDYSLEAAVLLALLLADSSISTNCFDRRPTGGVDCATRSAARVSADWQGHHDASTTLLDADAWRD